MDDYLSSLDLWRKPIAKDESSLYRCIAEQVFSTQTRWEEVRDECEHYIKEHEEELETEWLGVPIEINALSLLYRRDIYIYEQVRCPPVNLTQNEFKDVIWLCYTDGCHYDCVYPRTFVTSSAICQSIVYEILYKNVFKMSKEVHEGVQLLRNKNFNKRRDSHSPCYSSSPETQEYYRKHHVSVSPPFPYRIAKALDPDIYRNVEYDTWMEAKKELERTEQQLVEKRFTTGDKCQVTLESSPDHVFIAHIQEMGSEKDPVTVFIEELGERHTVTFEQLRALPQAEGYPPLCKKKQRRRKLELPFMMPVGRGSQGRGIPHQGMRTPPPRFSNFNGMRPRRALINSAGHPVHPGTGHPIHRPRTFNSPSDSFHRQSGYVTPERQQSSYVTPERQHSRSSKPASPQVQQPYMTPPPQVQQFVSPPTQLQFYPFLVIPYVNNLTGPVNLNAQASMDNAGSDLPNGDVNTLRFFYNIGVEHFRLSTLMHQQQNLGQQPMPVSMPVTPVTPNQPFHVDPTLQAPPLSAPPFTEKDAETTGNTSNTTDEKTPTELEIKSEKKIHQAVPSYSGPHAPPTGHIPQRMMHFRPVYHPHAYHRATMGHPQMTMYAPPPGYVQVPQGHTYTKDTPFPRYTHRANNPKIQNVDEITAKLEKYCQLDSDENINIAAPKSPSQESSTRSDDSSQEDHGNNDSGCQSDFSTESTIGKSKPDGESSSAFLPLPRPSYDITDGHTSDESTPHDNTIINVPRKFHKKNYVPRIVRPMKDIPPRFQQMLTPKKPDPEKFAGPPLVQQTFDPNPYPDSEHDSHKYVVHGDGGPIGVAEGSTSTGAIAYTNGDGAVHYHHPNQPSVTNVDSDTNNLAYCQSYVDHAHSYSGDGGLHVVNPHSLPSGGQYYTLPSTPPSHGMVAPSGMTIAQPTGTVYYSQPPMQTTSHYGPPMNMQMPAYVYQQ
ncbi:unnamed protein product [Owenia fusiformis]|uniref:Uncharacterized protein n=1 Tax=Owenia fusiformis TaxID=6347 RepID=A0A8J1XLR9_OWEFU|nr:unnamed protein product [Owenia fusiformis]